MTRFHPLLGIAMVLASGGLFAVNGTVSKLVLIGTDLDPVQLTTLRTTGAAAGLLLLCLLRLFVRRPPAGGLRIRRGEVPLLVGYGLTGFFLVPTLYFVAISRLPIGIALLFEYTAPLFVALWARFGQHATVRPRLWAGLVSSLAGLACVAQVWDGFMLDAVGVAAGIGAAVLLAGYYVLGARGVRDRDPLPLTFWAFSFAALAGMLVRPWWSFPFAEFGRTSDGLPVWLLSGYLVAFGSIAPYLLVAGALRHLPATSVGIIGMIEPVIAAAVAWLVLGEALDPAQLAGGALVLFGVTVAETARANQTQATRSGQRHVRDQAQPSHSDQAQPSHSDQAQPSHTGQAQAIHTGHRQAIHTDQTRAHRPVEELAKAIDSKPNSKPSCPPAYGEEQDMGYHDKARSRPDCLGAEVAQVTSVGGTPRSGEPTPAHPNVQAVQDALDAADARDASGQPCRVRILSEPVHTAAAAAAALGVDVGQIANSLIFDADGEPVLVLTSGAHRVDTSKVASAVGATSVRRASAEFVRQHTGQPIGGVAPLGHTKPIRTLVDIALRAYPQVWAAGGIPQAVFPTTYAELVRITAGLPVDVA